jgi:hypothetical protein
MMKADGEFSMVSRIQRHPLPWEEGTRLCSMRGTQKQKYNLGGPIVCVRKALLERRVMNRLSQRRQKTTLILVVVCEFTELPALGSTGSPGWISQGNETHQFHSFGIPVFPLPCHDQTDL